MQTILNVIEWKAEVKDGVLLKVELRLSCGHSAEPNPIYAYKVGAEYKCFACNHPVKP